MKSVHEYLECECGTAEHTIRLSPWIDKDDPHYSFLSIEVHLTALPWRRRIWIALAYILGRKSKYGWGCFDEATLNVEQVAKLRNLCNKFIDHRHGVGNEWKV